MIRGVSLNPRRKRLGLRTPKSMVFQDASRLILRYHWERTKPLHTRVVRLLARLVSGDPSLRSRVDHRRLQRGETE